MSVWPFLAALVASGTALLIAFRAYPWQKQLDRELKISEEKRLAYQRFFEATETYFAKLRSAAFDRAAELPSAEFARLEASKTELALRGGEKAVSACVELAQALKEYRSAVKQCTEAAGAPTTEQAAARDRAYRIVNGARVAALLAARQDAGISSDTTASQETIERLFMIRR